jgi:hypothetical protein
MSLLVFFFIMKKKKKKELALRFDRSVCNPFSSIIEDLFVNPDQTQHWIGKTYSQ